MAKKTKAQVIFKVADGAGGMAQVEDRRFERRDGWLSFDVPRAQADTWLDYLSAECRRRKWSSGGIVQNDRTENSGSLTISTGGPDRPKLAIVWERKRRGPIKVRYRSEGGESALGDAEDLFARVNERCRTGSKELFYRHGQLAYQGLPWRGELWLDDTLRLGPPALEDETALLGPRVITVDAEIESIDSFDSGSVFNVRLRELSVFLAVVMNRSIQVAPSIHRAWTFPMSPGEPVEFELRNVGYYEPALLAAMPVRGQAPAVPLTRVDRPVLSSSGVSLGDNEQQLPADIVDLWEAFMGLPADRRQQFLQVGSMWQAALSLDREYETTRFAWMVATCEALKPPGGRFNRHNIYDVVESLLGESTADVLKERWFRAQNVRNAHLHAGEFRGSEFVPHSVMPSFQDPTFDQASRALARIVPAAIVEWLKRGGKLTMPPLKRRRRWLRWLKGHAVFVR